MASIQLLKRRIRSIRNTEQITKAMELVAAARLRRIQEAAKKSRIYSEAALSVMQRLSKTPEAAQNRYFTASNSSGKLYITYNSDRGLAGAYNSNVFNAAARAFAEDQKNGLLPLVIAFGRKGARYFSRGTNIELLGAYENIADNPDINVFAPLIETISEGIDSGRFGEVNLIFTESISTMVQKVRILPLVPITAIPNPEEKDSKSSIVYEMEPDTAAVIQTALRIFFESNLRRAYLEAVASEHAMRMISMGNAHRNAGDLIDSLTLELNATRQASITQEVAEIIGGAEAIS
jgi:F-type H+-transporting ATPase subunit gamma